MNTPAASSSARVPIAAQQPQGGHSAKEIEQQPNGSIHAESLPLTEIGRPVEATPGMTEAGVSIAPTAIPIPRNLADMGVEPVGQNVPVSTGEGIVLPLSDSQILEGEKQPKNSSWYFLSRWCRRQLEKVKLAVHTVKGKPTEIPI